MHTTHPPARKRIPANHCGICEEKFRPNQERAEMYNPDSVELDQDAVLCHAQCGLSRGYEVA